MTDDHVHQGDPGSVEQLYCFLSGSGVMQLDGQLVPVKVRTSGHSLNHPLYLGNCDRRWEGGGGGHSRVTGPRLEPSRHQLNRAALILPGR